MEVLPMNPQQKNFVRYLLTDPAQNQTHAYKKVYPNVSASVAASNASRMLRRAKVKAALEKGRAKLAAKAEKEELIGRDFVLACMRKSLDVNGAVVTDDSGVQEFVSDTSFNKAIEMAAKLHGMLTDKQTITVEKSFDDILDDIERSNEK